MFFNTLQCVESVRHWIFFVGLYVPAFWLIEKNYRANLPIQSEYRKMLTRKNLNMEIFHAALYLLHAACFRREVQREVF